MSTLWTPSGEHQPRAEDDDLGRPDRPERGGPAAADAPVREATPEEAAEIMRARAELASVPVADIIANHAVGLWQLALLHLMPDPQPDGTHTPPRLQDAALAIDAFAAVVDGLGARLAPHDEALREALGQLRLAYVEIAGREDAPTRES
jgi:hypothetical protein